MDYAIRSGRGTIRIEQINVLTEQRILTGRMTKIAVDTEEDGGCLIHCNPDNTCNRIDLKFTDLCPVTYECMQLQYSYTLASPFYKYV